MEQSRTRHLAEAIGTAGAAKAVVQDCKVAVSVLLKEEEFHEALIGELSAMEDRLYQIAGDLGLLSRDSGGLPEEWGAAERYRLAHRGQEPAPDADADQLAAIEDRAAA